VRRAGARYGTFPRTRSGRRARSERTVEALESTAGRAKTTSTGTLTLRSSEPTCGSCYTAMFKLRAVPGFRVLDVESSIDIPGAEIGGAPAPFLLEAPGWETVRQVLPIFQPHLDSP
jgi:hypothetical protein